jgi:hypothetical protein
MRKRQQMDLAWIGKAQHPMLDHMHILLISNLEQQFTQKAVEKQLFTIEWWLV